MKLRTNFRRKLLVLAIAPLAIAQLVMLFAVMQTVEKDVDQRARGSLRIGAEVVGEYLASRSEQLRTSVQVLAADFGLKEAAVTGDAETIRSVLRNHSRRVGADRAILLDLTGSVIATTDDVVTRWRTDFSDLIGDGDSSRQIIDVVGTSTYQVFIVPLRAPTTIGWIIFGFRIDGVVVDRLAALTGLGVVLVNTGNESILVASTESQHYGLSGGEYLAPSSSPPNSVYVIGKHGEGQLALSSPVLDGNDTVQIVLTRSVKEAMAPYVDARRGLIIFAIALLTLVAVAAAWVAGGIARPLRALTTAARKISSGQYGINVGVASDDEIGELASSFNIMRTAVADREQRIYHQSMHDSLTNLPNRGKIVEQLSTMIANGEHQNIAVLSVRLSRMNEISATLGHSASDELIKLAARRLAGQLEKNTLLGHTGTDEFVIAIPVQDEDHAYRAAEIICGSLNGGVLMGTVNLTLQSTIGIAIYPFHGVTASVLLGNAMIAKTEAQFSEEPVALYKPGREEFYIKQLRIVNDLRHATQRNQLTVCYQPKVNLETGCVTGAEALVRWRHPEYGLLSPDEFIPAAEEAGMIHHVTRYMLEAGIMECRKWHVAGYDLQVSINISTLDLLDSDLPYFILQLLKDHSVEPKWLTLEVTENAVMRKIQRALSVLECLQDIGVKISMDDFGTGQSSLAQMKNIPLHELKIDKSFVMTLLSDKKNEAIVMTILQLANNLGFSVVAEGVEDQSTIDFLQTAGCTLAQGYFISKPIESEAFLNWMEGSRSRYRKDRRSPGRAFRRMANRQ